MSKIIITTSSFNCDAPEIRALQDAGYEIVLNPHQRRLNEEEVAALLADDVVGMIAGLEPLTAAVIKGAAGLKVISRCGTGMDNVDQDAAAARGIKVVNTPDAPARAVAELTMALMLGLMRMTGVQDSSIRAGGWDRPMGRLLSEQVVGLIGYGRIGKLVAKHLSGFGCRVLAYDPFVKETLDVECVSLDVLSAQSDVISLHTPLTEDNHHMVNAAFLAQMKDGAFLVNTARGELIDEQSLYEALSSGALGGAALDVYQEEPYTGPLSQLKNVLLTAHTGSYAYETRMQQEAEAARNLLACLKEKDMKDRQYG
jgi:D-3-phosphoglycerate dehydrogenase